MDTLVTAIISSLAGVMASSGFWAYMSNRSGRKDAIQSLLLGLAHDRIIFLGMSYIKRGHLTKDEYEDFRKYLYDPYSKFGGNGLADKVMIEVNKLPFENKSSPIATVLKEKDDERGEE